MAGRYKAMGGKLLRLESINRSYRVHLKAIRDKCDYLLKHPYATDKGVGRKGTHKKIKTKK